MESGQKFYITRFSITHWIKNRIWTWKNLNRKKNSSSEFSLSIVKLSIESESNYRAIKFCELSKPQQEIAELNLFIASLADLED